MAFFLFDGRYELMGREFRLRCSLYILKCKKEEAQHRAMPPLLFLVLKSVFRLSP